MKSHWVENKGKRVFIADFSNFRDNGAGVHAECQAIIGELEAQPVHRRALVEMTGFRCHFLYAFSKVIGDVNFTLFDTTPEALD